MSNPTAQRKPARTVGQMLLLAPGVFFLSCALLYNEFTVGWGVKIARSIESLNYFGTFDPVMARWMQLGFLVVGVVFVAFSRATKGLSTPRAQNALLVVLAIVVPLITLELGLRPLTKFESKPTSLFLRDDDLGWKFRPNARDIWGGVEVRINGKGLRGPERPYEKPAGTKRILYLGDSVTFGYKLSRWRDGFPFVVESNLDSALTGPVETVNAGVGGYSPWQQRVYLANEGIKYNPDLVVLAFVLNDVTERFGLARFGGAGLGFQLQRSHAGLLDRLEPISTVVFHLRRIVVHTRARIQLGKDPQLGAIRQQALEVMTLIEKPEQDNVKLAWEMTLANVQGVVDFCRGRDLPILLVSYPFAVQLDDPQTMSAPQRVLESFAQDNDVPFIDMLPILHEYMTTNEHAPTDLFFDEDHLTRLGCRVVAREIARRILAENWLSEP